MEIREERKKPGTPTHPQFTHFNLSPDYSYRNHTCICPVPVPVVSALAHFQDPATLEVVLIIDTAGRQAGRQAGEQAGPPLH